MVIVFVTDAGPLVLEHAELLLPWNDEGTGLRPAPTPEPDVNHAEAS